MKKICIFGAGGSAKETYWIAKRCGYEIAALLDICDGGYYDQAPIKQESFFDKEKYNAIIAIGNSDLRQKITAKILDRYGNVFVSLIDPSVILLSQTIKIGIGAIVAPMCVLTCDVNIGDFCQLNVSTNIMHDVVAGDFFTTAPGVHINGKVNIGNCVYFGSNSSTVEEISVCNNVVIGAAACVSKDIIESGTYVGVPAKKLEKRKE